MPSIEKGVYLFKKNQALNAAKIAYNETAPIKGKAAAIKKFIATFFSRKVEVNNPNLLELSSQKLLEECIEKKFCCRSVSKTSNHFIERTGEAVTDSKRVAVCSWASSGIKKPGHSSLGIEDDNTKEYAYVSYWPKSKVALEKKAAIKYVAADHQESIEDDMFSEMSDSTCYQLERAQQAQRRINNGKALPGDEENARFKPMANQRLIGTQDEWGTVPEVTYVPAVGDITDINGKAKFNFFGLDIQKMKQVWHQKKTDAENGALKYRMADPKLSCAGMTKQILQAGGGELYEKGKLNIIYTSPNEVYRYAQAITQTTEQLNKEVQALYEEYEVTKQNADLVAFSHISTLTAERFTSFFEKYQAEFNQSAPAQHKEILSLIDDIFHGKQHLPTLTKKLKRLVRILEKNRTSHTRNTDTRSADMRLLTFSIACLKRAESNVRNQLGNLDEG